MPVLKAGFATVDMTPALPFPLAGEVTRRERLAQAVLDPLEAVAVAFTEGSTTAALVTVDLLIIDHDLYQDVLPQVQQLGVNGLFLSATHTHSSFGGYLKVDKAAAFMGHHRPEVREKLIASIVQAVKLAQADLSPVQSVEFSSAHAPGLTMNRRVQAGPTDDWVQAIDLKRADRPTIAIVSTSGHPVVGMVHAPNGATADYPGRVRRALAARGENAIYLTSGLGGCNILFPEMTQPMNTHLDMLQDRILTALDRARLAPKDCLARAPHFRFRCVQETLTPKASPRVGGLSKAGLVSFAAGNLGDWYAGRLTLPQHPAPVTLLRLGRALLVGMPSDFGVGATLTLRAQLETLQYRSIIASHTNDYVGYMHMAQEYGLQPSHNPQFFHYENAMTWYGADAGDKLMQRALETAGQL